MLATATGPHLYWIASRAAGSAALILSSISVSIGLLMGGRLLRGRSYDLRVVHEALSLATLAAIAVHGLTLLGDGFLKLSIADISVPFASGYMTLWTTVGIVSFWMLLALGLSYYARARIGVKRWRTLHRFTALAWILGIAHSLGEGSDAGEVWFLAMTAVAVLPALALLCARLFGSSQVDRADAGKLVPDRAARHSSATSQAEISALASKPQRVPWTTHLTTYQERP